MTMTSAQMVTFKAALSANSALAAARAAKNASAIAIYYNESTSPAVAVWRPSITIAELNNAIVWSEYLTAAEPNRSAYAAMIAGGSVDATKPNIQSGFATIFAGSVSLVNLQALAKRTATRFEALFVVNGVSSVFGYVVTLADVGVALEA